LGPAAGQQQRQQQQQQKALKLTFSILSWLQITPRTGKIEDQKKIEDGGQKLPERQKIKKWIRSKVLQAGSKILSDPGFGSILT